MLYPVLQDPLHQIVSSLFDRPRGASIGQMLFGAGEQGAWYDVADMSTLFQDAAGTTPVTAVEQQVGRMLDKSGRGNHATQVTATKRPVFSRRYNTWLSTEDPASFGTLNASLTAAPAGPLHFELADDTATGVHLAHIGYLSFGENKTFTCSFLAKPLASSRYLYVNVAGGVPAVVFDLLNGVVVLGGGTEDLSSEISLDASTGICACKMRFTQELTFTNSAWRFGLTTTGVNEQSYAGGGTQRVALGSISITEGAFDIPYQRVNTATDYDADPSKFPAYLRFDGVDDALQTGNIDFTSTDKMTVWAGVTKLSDAGLQMISELSTNAGSTSGSFWLLGGDNSTGASGWGALAGGTTRPLMRGVDSVAPINSVLTLKSDISGSVSSMRSNGALKATATSTHGTGSFASAPLFIGARDGTSLYFNGRLYSLILRGAQTPLSQIEATELYIKQKMRLP